MKPLFLRSLSAVLILLTCPSWAPAQTIPAAPITLESLFHPLYKKSYVNNRLEAPEWLPDGGLLQIRANENPTSFELLRMDPKKGETRVLASAAAIKAAFRSAGVAEAAFNALLPRPALIWNKARTAFLLQAEEDLYLMDLITNRARRLTHGSGPEEEAEFSPNGQHIAYLRGSDLYVTDIATGKEQRLTQGGTETLLNGRLDWVYQEEIYGRGRFKGFWWAPDSQRLAFLSLDIGKVPQHTLMDDRFQPQKPLTLRYPKAGDPNPVAKLGQVDLRGSIQWMADPYPGQETLIVAVGFSPDSQLLASYQNRTQTWLELLRFEATQPKRLIREENKAWVESSPFPQFLKDGSFLWLSDRSGWRHVYHHRSDGALMAALTSGTWDVRELHGADEKNKRIFFSATERSSLDLDLYQVKWDGKAFKRLTEKAGTHRVKLSPEWTWFLDTWSDANTPPKLALHHAEKGKFIRALDENPCPDLKGLIFAESRFQAIPNRQGQNIETRLFLPPNRDPKVRYPVIQMVYGGPMAQTVRNAWDRDTLWYHFLASRGYIVQLVDNRSATNKGPVSAWPVYKKLGELELNDFLDALDWLKQQGFADTDRAAIDGWSFGGTMVAYALTHSKAYKLGLCGAPVTDWRLYDSIYTERYMGLPSDNQAGYDRSSCLLAASQLSGTLHLFHGTLDDNVHPQNTIQLLNALQKHGNQAILTLLPGSGHSPRNPDHIWAIRRAAWESIGKYL